MTMPSSSTETTKSNNTRNSFMNDQETMMENQQNPDVPSTPPATTLYQAVSANRAARRAELLRSQHSSSATDNGARLPSSMASLREDLMLSPPSIPLIEMLPSLALPNPQRRNVVGELLEGEEEANAANRRRGPLTNRDIVQAIDEVLDIVGRFQGDDEGLLPLEDDDGRHQANGPRFNQQVNVNQLPGAGRGF